MGLFPFAVRRALQLVPVLLGLTLIVFALQAAALGDPVRAAMGQRGDPEAIARIRADYGLDAPLWVQYGQYLRRLLRGDLGRSFRQQVPVAELIAERLPATLRLALAAMGLAALLGVAAGVAAAVGRGRLLDAALMTVALLGISTPVFWLGMMLILLFAVTLGWFPISGYGQGDWRHLVLPALTLGALHVGYIARMTRSSLLEVLREDYLRTARAKGLRESVVLLKHGLRNASLPILTLVGIGVGDLLVGAPLTETVFAWPGLGRLLVAAAANRDLPVVLGATLLFALIYVAANLLVDLCYVLADPRLRFAGGQR
ncbi:MAG: ABC transporter permease [candidate division NC10 bacterium]|nr:ABC transporter permease [candidate division NC10 bacterium]